MVGVALWEQAQGVSSHDTAGGAGAGVPRAQHAEREGVWGAQRGGGCLGEVGVTRSRRRRENPRISAWTGKLGETERGQCYKEALRSQS